MTIHDYEQPVFNYTASPLNCKCPIFLLRIVLILFDFLLKYKKVIFSKKHLTPKLVYYIPNLQNCLKFFLFFFVGCWNKPKQLFKNNVLFCSGSRILIRTEKGFRHKLQWRGMLSVNKYFISVELSRNFRRLGMQCSSHMHHFYDAFMVRFFCPFQSLTDVVTKNCKKSPECTRFVLALKCIGA